MASPRNEAVAKLVQKELERRACEDVSQMERMAFSELKNAANNFLMQLNFSSQMFTHQDLVKRMQAVKSLTQALYTGMRADSTYTQSILMAQENFESVLNKFLNRHIYLTHVSDEGGLTAYSDVAVGQIYQQATGNVGRGNVGAGVLKNIIDIDEEVQAINEELRKSARKRQVVYTKAIERWKSNSKEGNKNYNPSVKTFYWRINPPQLGWTSKIDTQGVIAEGYAEAVINNRNDVLNSALESSLKTLWEKYIQKDSVPAAVKGDVVLDGTNVQFAIKQGNFSTAKIGQYINLAFNITRLNDDIIVQDFYLALPKLLSLSKTANKIVSIMNNKAQNAVEQIIKANLSGAKLSSAKWDSKVDLMGLS